MILAEGILDEIQHQAEVQGRKNYRCIEVDYRTILAMVKEIRDCRVSENSKGEIAVYDEEFSVGENLLYKGNVYEFVEKTKDGFCKLSNDKHGVFFVDPCDVRRMIDISATRGNFKAGEHVVFADNEFVFVRYSDQNRVGGCFLKPKEDVCNEREFHVLACNVSRSPF